MLNGMSVAVGIALVQLTMLTTVGGHAAQLAVGGAVCASLADVPNTPLRALYRVLAAALLSTLAAFTVLLLKTNPLWLAPGIAAVTFLAMMTMAWGQRAAAVSFAPVLSMVFSMAVPTGGVQALPLAAWSAAGSALYLCWALLSSWLLQPLFRRQALVATLQAAARLFRTRADLVAKPLSEPGDVASMRSWIGDEAALAERLQSARDLLFVGPDTERARRGMAMLLRVIDLRDILLASRLDIDLLRDDTASGRFVRERLREGLVALADALDQSALALSGRADAPDPQVLLARVQALFDDAPTGPEGDAGPTLAGIVAGRLRHLAGDVARIHALLRGAQEGLPLSMDQLRGFVAPEGWPWSSVRQQLHLRSPVLRHALRTALALATAYVVGHLLPWASHPHWLVLSVAVVLRGSLEQTLARRNTRVLGTMVGCLVVLGIAELVREHYLPLVFLVAAGTSHAFLNVMYVVTATAATVMALLQAHLVDPGSGFAVGERLADTFLGAVLAWGFSYVLPSWERRAMPVLVSRTLQALRDYANLAMTEEHTGPHGAVQQRLARRRAYDALSALAAAAQRSTVEPRQVRLPLRELFVLLDHGQRLMAHLSMIRLMLARNSPELDSAEAHESLRNARGAMNECLDPARREGEGSAHVANGAMPVPALPLNAPEQNRLPWLKRRLAVAVQDAQRVREGAAQAVRVLHEPRAPARGDARRA